MTLDDFIESPDGFSIKHKKYPICVWVTCAESFKHYSNWVCSYSTEEIGVIKIMNIPELYGKPPESVTEDYLNLLMLKYLMI